MNLANKEHKALLIFLIFVAIFRLLVAPYFGLGVDEAHYLIYAQKLDWSYFDHPPLVGWVQYIFTSIFGMNEFGARVSAISIGFFTSIFIYILVYQIEQNAKKSFIAILALHGALMFNALFLMLMPDTLLFLLIMPIIFATIKLQKNDSLKNWLFLGLLLGLAGLSKYTAALFLAPIILYFIIKKRFDIFINPKILIAITIATIIISPVLYWNIEHNWISFTYQSEHVVGNSHLSMQNFAKSLAAQLFAYNPFLFIVAFYGLISAFKSKNDILFLSALFGGILFLFFTYSSFYKVALPHWSALFYMLFIPIGAYYLYDKSLKWKRYIKFAIFFGIFISSLIYIEVATKVFPLPDEKLQLDIYSFKKVMKEANRYIKNPKKEAIGVINWTLASRAIFYNEKYNSKVYLLDNRKDQFDLWQKESPIGKDIVIIDIKFFHKDINKYLKCNGVKPLESFNIVQLHQKEKFIKLLKCINYQGLR